MFDNLLALVQQHAGDAIIKNDAIPNERNDEAVQLASSSIFDTLKNSVGNGNVGDIVNMFTNNNNGSNNAMAGIMQNDLVQNLMHKFGIDANAAGGIAQNLIPTVLNNLVSKTNDPNDSSFDLQDIVSKVGGGNLDIQSIIGNFTGNSTAENGKNSGGGIMDSLKGLFGN
ncbi:MAG TPA: DUF937 domain-containing protein [Chitinophagaceae bacterium]|jgi:hypothetical protein|nr:hypothetical protein [Chitinophagaceae bacterium]MBP9740300.1 hypothetical protein [Chitinophagaceae bacterium]HPH23338.1 DUF937 domain-containing protein [Chitinophagaceae bacterium]